MKAPKTILFVAAWAISLLVAYTVGRNLQSDAGIIQARQSQTSNQDDQKVIHNAAVTSEQVVTDLELTQPGGRTPDQIRDAVVTALAGPQNTPQARDAINDLLQELAKTNPEEALELAGQIKSMRASEQAKLAILETWASYDPVAALTWAETGLANETTTVRNSQLSAIYRGYAMLNPEAALQAASQLSDSTSAERRLKTRLMGEVIETQIENGELVAAKQSIELMADGDLKTSLMREMVDEWASFDPEAAAAYVNSLGPDVDNSLKMALVREWAENDPVAAAEWLGTLEEGDPTVSRAAADIIQEWARYDLTASAEWLNSLPASPELDRAVASYTFRAVQEDPATAMSWAESVTNDRMQGYLQQRVAGAWKEDDPAGFQDYLDQSDLSEEDKEKLMNSNAWGGGRGPGGGPRRRL